jgi:bifunctional nuclease
MVSRRFASEIKEVDARPSDILALAVRSGSPIYVATEVMQQASKDMETYENETGKFTPGEGVEAILQEEIEMLKQFEENFRQTPPQTGEKTMESSQDEQVVKQAPPDLRCGDLDIDGGKTSHLPRS